MFHRNKKLLMATLSAISILLSSISGALPAFAASTVMAFSATPVISAAAPSSAPIPVVQFGAMASQEGQTMSSVTVNFTGTGLVQGDFAPIATGVDSGVALYTNTPTDADNFDVSDTIVPLAPSPSWTTDTTNITLTPATPITLLVGTPKIFYIVVRTSAGATNNHVITATIPANGVATSDGNGPASPFTSDNNITVQTAGPSLVITTPNIPTATVGTTYTAETPLVALTATGGTAPRTFTADTTADPQTAAKLAAAGLSLSADGKLIGTILNVPGSVPISIKATDSTEVTPLIITRVFTLNIAPSGGTGGVPGITQVGPSGAAQDTSSISVTITGVNTHFTSSSTVSFLNSNTPDSNLTVSNISATSSTSLSFTLAVTGEASPGMRDVRVATGSEVATLPNAFGVFPASGPGLNLQMPGSSATNIQIPTGFSFSPSSAVSVNTYRITVKTAADFSGTALWDYAFPKPNEQNSNGSHCNANGCNVQYGTGTFRVITQPTQQSPDSTYYWRVKTYTQSPDTISGDTVATETSEIRGFTTTDSITDVVAPTTQHRPIFNATASTSLNVFARVNDNVAKPESNPPLTSSLKYCVGASCTPTTNTTGTFIGGGYIMYTIPDSIISTAGTIIRYFLASSDGTNSATFKGKDDSPFTITSTASGAYSITGTVKDNSNVCIDAIKGATVFADGTGFSTTTDDTCAFTLGGLKAGAYDLVAIMDTFADRNIMGVAAQTTGIEFKLPTGSNGGFGGDTTKPQVMFTAPQDNMNNMPGNDSNFKIVTGFSKPMSQTSVTATGNMMVKEINNSTGDLTDITSDGSWTYYNTAPSTPGMPTMNNVAVWRLSEGNTLGDGKTFAIVISPNVVDTSGNPINGNQSDGSYTFSFSTGSSANFSGFNEQTGEFATGGTLGSGKFVQPHVIGITPAPGSFNIPLNQKIMISFSDPMASDTDSYILKNFLRFYSVSGTTETNISSSISTVELDSSGLNAIVSFTGNLSAGVHYRVKILGGAKASSGLALMEPSASSSVAFSSDFQTGANSTTDTNPPLLTGSYPTDGSTNIPVNIGAINIGFSKDMDVSTLTSSSVSLSVGSTTVSGTVTYNPMDRQVFFLPSSVLSPNTTYTITASTNIKALNGVALASAASATFTTGIGDTTAPSVSFAKADDYSLAVTFSEPMNAAKASDTSRFANSVLKPGNYTIKYGNPGASASGTTMEIPLSASLSFDSVSNTVTISGYHDDSVVATTLHEKELYILVSNVSDLSSNAINESADTAKTVILDSSETKGALSPMAKSDDAFSTGGGFAPSNFSTTTFGFAPPVEVQPQSKLPSQTTRYNIHVPISKQIPSGGSIVFSFPTGFNISGAIQDVNSPMRNDLNGQGSGTVTFKCTSASAPTGAGCSGTSVAADTAVATYGGAAHDGIIVDASARTITVYISAATNTEGHDMLNLDISGIINTSIPKDFTTSGYTVDIKTKSADGGTVIESMTSKPFFIQSGVAAGGSTYTISGTVTATGNTSSGTMQIYLMSPITGPLSTTTSNFGGGSTAPYSFTNLPPGDYKLFTEQNVELGVTDFVGKTIPDFVSVNGNVTHNFTLTNASSGGTALTVNVSGPANENLDIFAGSPVGFRVKQIQLDGDGLGSAELTLTNGNWNLGVGPQIPKGGAATALPPTSYLPPKPVPLIISDPSCLGNGVTDCAITITLATATKTIKGTVKDDTGKVMAGAQINAYSPTGGMGTFGTTDSSGAFVLYVADGSYIVRAFIPGMSSSKEVPVIVTSNATTYLLIDSANTAITPSAALSSFVLGLAKPPYTISGKVTDGTNTIQGASVHAYRTDGPGNANTMTDSSGNYTLYVDNGTWKVGSFLPQYGSLSEQTLVISSVSQSNINFSPSQTGTGTFYTISGTVTAGGSPVQGAFINVNGTNGAFNQTSTSTDGTYSLKVPSCATAGCYTVQAFTPRTGKLSPLASFSVTENTAGKDFTIATLRTVTINFSASVQNASIDLSSTNGSASHITINNASTGNIQLPDGSYKVHVDVPGAPIGPTDISGTGYNNTTSTFTVSAAQTALTVTLPTLRTLTGTVDDGTDPVANAWVEIGSPSAGIHFGTQTAADGTFSLKVSDGTYFINAMKPGYFRQATALIVNEETGAQTLSLATASRTISGTVLIGDTGAPNALVRAEKVGGGFSGTQADATGNYILPVDSGVWSIYGVADGYKEAASSSNPITVTGADISNADVTLVTSIAVAPPASTGITPASGGTLHDETGGVTITVPANTLGTSTSTGNLQLQETTNVSSTSTATPLSSYDGTANYVPTGKEIDATDNSGNAISTLNGEITLSMKYTKAELANTRSSQDASIDTKSEVDQIKMGYWDTANLNWVTLPSTVTYYDSDSAVLSDPAEDLSDTSSVIITASTPHLSTYAPIVSTDPSAPAAPTGPAAATGNSSGVVNLTWTIVSGATGYDVYRSTTSNGTYARLGSDPTVSSGSTNTYAATGSASTTYYFKITALNASGESASSSVVSAVSGSTPTGSGGGPAPSSGSSGSSSSSTTTPATPATPATPTVKPATPATPASATKAISDFKDLKTLAKTSWQYPLIQQMLELGLMVGSVNTKGELVWNMNAGMTRAEAAVLIARYIGYDDKTKVTINPFSDVYASTWFASSVAHLKSFGIISGKTATMFIPAGSITRAEFFKMAAAAYVQLHPTIAAEWSNIMETGSNTFSDVTTSDWFHTYMNLAEAKKLLTGYTVKGKKLALGSQGVSRVEAVSMLTKLMGLK